MDLTQALFLLYFTGGRCRYDYKIAEALSASIILYTNPSSGIVNVKGDFDAITVSDIIGSPIFTTSKSVLDLSQLSNGTYFVRFPKVDHPQLSGL